MFYGAERQRVSRRWDRAAFVPRRGSDGLGKFQGVRSGVGWFLAGVVFGVFGTLAALRLRELREEDVDDLAEDITRRLDEMEALLS